MIFHVKTLYAILILLSISTLVFSIEENSLKQEGKENPYGWSLDQIPWDIQDQTLRKQKWVKSEEPFLYPQEEGCFLNATVYSLKQPAEKIDVIWQEYERKRIPYLIRVAGESSKWHLEKSVVIGTNWTKIENMVSVTLPLNRIPVRMDGPDEPEDFPGFLCDSSYYMSFSVDNGLLPKILPMNVEHSNSVQQIESIELIFDYEEPKNTDNDQRNPQKDFFVLREIQIRYPKRGNLLVGKPPLKSPYLLNPGESAGPICRDTNLMDLEKIFGKDNLTSGIVNDTEDLYSTATLVFDKDPLRRIAVAWDHSALYKKVDFVSIEYTYRSLWHLDSGLTIGTSLKTFERINGGVFSMNCFYSDNLWGRTAGKFKSTMWVKFSYLWCAGKQIDWKKHPEIHGSREQIESSNLQLQRMNPRVERIDVYMH